MKAVREKRKVASRVSLLTLCGIVLLGGCSGGMLGNLVPLPKILKGDVRNNVYYAKNDLFSITSPFAQDSGAYTYAEIKEIYKDGQGFVAFSSSMAPGQYYHVDVKSLPGGSSDSIGLDAAADNAIDNIQKMQANAGREPFVLVKQEPWNAKYTTGIIRLYTQKVPADKVVTDSDKKYFTAYNLMYVTKGSGKVAVVLADWLVDAGGLFSPGKMTNEDGGNDRIMNAFSGNERAWKFINTINLNVESAPKQGSS